MCLAEDISCPNFMRYVVLGAKSDWYLRAEFRQLLLFFTARVLLVSRDLFHRLNERQTVRRAMWIFSESTAKWTSVIGGGLLCLNPFG